MPKRQCNHPGCPVLVDEGCCEKHTKVRAKQKEEGRKTAHQRGYTSKWRKARLGYLKSHPLCKHCEDRGIVEAATVVDHIVPHRGDKALFWDRSNWQPLCKPCHDRKTATEDGGFTGWNKGEAIEGEFQRVNDVGLPSL